MNGLCNLYLPQVCTSIGNTSSKQTAHTALAATIAFQKINKIGLGLKEYFKMLSKNISK